jgi:urease accessory protein
MKKVAAFFALLTPSIVFAHAGHTEAATFFSGFLHPWTGIDHLLALIASGLWLTLSDTRYKLPLLALFSGVLLLAILLGYSFVGVAFESAISATLVILALLLVIGRSCSVGIFGFVLTAVAAVHGLVHGAELTTATANPGYVCALVLSSACLMALIIAIGRLIRGHSMPDRNTHKQSV